MGINEKVISKGCSCTAIVDTDGYGNCKKKYEGSFGCFVHTPTTCSDTQEFNGILFSISEACLDSMGIFILIAGYTIHFVFPFDDITPIAITILNLFKRKIWNVMITAIKMTANTPALN